MDSKSSETSRSYKPYEEKTHDNIDIDMNIPKKQKHPNSPRGEPYTFSIVIREPPISITHSPSLFFQPVPSPHTIKPS